MNRLSGKVGFGAPSIILILAVTVLVIFSSLSLVSANNDVKLTDKTIEASADYYKADDKAQRILAEADEIYSSGESADEILGTEITGENGSYEFLLDIDGHRQLLVRFSCSSAEFKITDHRIIQKNDKGEGGT